MENYQVNEAYSSYSKYQLDTVESQVKLSREETKGYFQLLLILTSVVTAFSFVGVCYYLISTNNHAQVMGKLDEIEQSVENEQYRILQEQLAQQNQKEFTYREKCTGFILFRTCTKEVK